MSTLTCPGSTNTASVIASDASFQITLANESRSGGPTITRAGRNDELADRLSATMLAIQPALADTINIP
ncbi:hypothetical protein GCM10007242_40610 [Pigmentiphaga litoralis]|nr:hypothetical protein GCM10007242_40610 [Pigmentiphaga litoralis]